MLLNAALWVYLWAYQQCLCMCYVYYRLLCTACCYTRRPSSSFVRRHPRGTINLNGECIWWHPNSATSFGFFPAEGHFLRGNFSMGNVSRGYISKISGMICRARIHIGKIAGDRVTILWWVGFGSWAGDVAIRWAICWKIHNPDYKASAYLDTFTNKGSLWTTNCNNCYNNWHTHTH